MRRTGVRVQIVWADLEGDETQRIEGRRLDDRHVFRRFERRAGDNRTGARSEVWHSFGYLPADRRQQFKVIETLKESKSIASTDEHCFCCVYRLFRVRGFMRGIYLIAHGRQALARRCGIGVPVVLRERNEQNASNCPQEVSDLSFGVIEIAAPIECRVAD